MQTKKKPYKKEKSHAHKEKGDMKKDKTYANKEKSLAN